MKSISKFLPLVAAVSLSVVATGQESSNYEEVIITSARVAQPVAESLAAVAVFTSADIESSQARDLSELLKSVSGLDLTSNGGRGANATIAIRGLPTDGTLVLVDGLRVSSATSGATAIQHIPLELIERVEVVKGPKSSLYGADALGGVIQVFTKGSLSASAPYVRLGYGSNDTYEAAAGFSYASQDSQISADITYEDSQGYSRVNTDLGADADDDGYDELGIALNGHHTYENGSKLYANYLVSTGNTEYDSGGEDSTDFKNQVSHLGYQIDYSDRFTINLQAGYIVDDRESLGTYSSLFKTERYSFSSQLDYRLEEDQVIVAGYEYFDDQVESTQIFTKNSRDNHAVFGQYLANYNVFSVQAGVRVDDNQAFGQQATGNLSVGFPLNDSIQSTLSYGTAFKAPTFNDLFYPFSPSPWGDYVGNPDLSPEESDTVELMLAGGSGNLEWSISLYKSNVDNLIDGYVYDADRDLFTSVNINEASMKGGELNWGYSTASWFINTGLSYVDAKDESAGERLSDTARAQANIDLGAEFGELNTVLSFTAQDGRLSGGNELGGYGLVDLRSAYDVSEELVLSISVRNLFDKNYVLQSGYSGDYNVEGRAATMSATYRF